MHCPRLGCWRLRMRKRTPPLGQPSGVRGAFNVSSLRFHSTWAFSQGAKSNLLHGEKLPFPESDYLKLTLTDLTPVLDAITRLKARYKNLLALEQPALFAEPAQDTAPREAISLDPAELFKEFYKNAAGRELSDEELEVLAEVLGAQNTKSREAA